MIALNLLRFNVKRSITNHVITNGYVFPKFQKKRFTDYANFTKDNFSKAAEEQKKTPSNVFKKSSQVWKNMSENQRNKYATNQDEINKYNKESEEYNKKFVQPFKNTKYSLRSFYLRKHSKGQKLNGRSISQFAKDMKQKFDKLSEQELNVLKKQLEQFKQKSSKDIEALKEYQIPTIEFSDAKQYFKHKLQKNNNDVLVRDWKSKYGELTKKELADVEAQYKKELANFKQKAKSFVQKMNIPTSYYHKIVRGEKLKTEKDESDKKQSQSVPKSEQNKPKRERKAKSADSKSADSKSADPKSTSQKPASQKSSSQKPASQKTQKA